MKTITNIFILTIILASCSTYSKLDGFEKFYDTYRAYNKVISFSPPTFIVNMLVDEDDFQYCDYFNNVDDYKIFISKNKTDSLYQLLNKALTKKLYNDMVVIKKNNKTISIKIRELDKYTSEIVFIIKKKTKFITISLKGEFYN